MADRIVLNNISYHGAGAIKEIVPEIQRGGYKHIFVTSDPDLIRFGGSDRVYVKQMRRICRAAKDLQIPVEINILGLKTGRNYPDERFWRIAAEEGNDVVLGVDAHDPSALLDAQSILSARAFAERFGLKPMETVRLRSLSEY